MRKIPKQCNVFSGLRHLAFCFPARPDVRCVALASLVNTSGDAGSCNFSEHLTLNPKPMSDHVFPKPGPSSSKPSFCARLEAAAVT